MTKLYFKTCIATLARWLKRIVTAASVLYGMVMPFNLLAQAPTLSYTGPQVFTAGTQISSLGPLSTGVASPAYSGTPVETSPTFQSVEYVAFDAAGNRYVYNAGSTSEVLEISASTSAITILASGINYEIEGMAVDAAGDVYLSGYTNILKIPAGGGTPVSIASGLRAVGIAIDLKGNIYFGETDPGDVKEIVVGNGAIVSLGSGWSNPTGVAVDQQGDVFVADGAIYEVRALDGTTVIINSTVPDAGGIAIDPAGNLYVVSEIFTDVNGNVTEQNALEEIPSGGNSFFTLANAVPYDGSVAPDNAGNIYFSVSPGNIVNKSVPIGGYFLDKPLPAGLSFNSSTGVISGTPMVISAAATYTITAYNSSGKTSATLSITVNAPLLPVISYQGPQTYPILSAITPLSPVNTGGAVAVLGYNSTLTSIGSGFNNPYGVAVDAEGNRYIADAGNNEVKRITNNKGHIVTTILGSGFSNPKGVAVDAAGNVYVADAGNNAIKEILASNGSVITLGSGFSFPAGVAVNAAGTVYVADSGNNMVKAILSGGDIGILGSGFLNPTGIAIDNSGDIYIADFGNNALKVIKPGKFTTSTISTGTGSSPYGVAADASGNIFFSDRTNKEIIEIPNNGGAHVTIANSFDAPAGIAADGAGHVYVADNSQTVLKEIVPTGGYFIQPALPAGLSMSNSSGIISGTPAALSAATTYTITGYNLGGGSAAGLSIQVTGNASLSALTLSRGTLTPAFASATTGYTDMVTNGTTSTTLTPTTIDAEATVTVNGATVASGMASGPISLNVGNNAVAIVVTGRDGTTKQTYTINVIRPSTNAKLSALTISAGTLTPLFNTNTTSYTASVPNATSSIIITPTAAGTVATIKVNGKTVASGNSTAAIALSAGANTITTVVTAQDGITTDTYTVIVTRIGDNNANLANLTPSKGTLSPVFTTATTSYTDMVTNGTTSVTLTPTLSDATATVTVNGTPVVSGHASGPITLIVGSNNVPVIVTAQDGVTTNTYAVNVIRPSMNAKLSALTISAGTLTPAFNANTASYTVAETNAASTVTITPTVAVTGATVKVNGLVVASGSPSGAIALSVGSNTIPVVVTAQDGVTTGTYTLTITRAAAGANNVYEPISVETTIDKPLFDDDGVAVHQGVSPNGDGINDFLQIDNIINYPDNKLSIMSRNGQLVFEAKGYDNSAKVFDGHSNKNGQMQLPGTYFYQLDYTVNGITKHKTGFLVLKY